MDWAEYADMSDEQFCNYKREWLGYYFRTNEVEEEEFDQYEEFFEDSINEWINNILANALLTYDGSCEWNSMFDGVSNEAVVALLTSMLETYTDL